MDGHQGLSDNLSLALFSLLQLHSLFISDEPQLAVQALQDLSCTPKVKLGVPSRPAPACSCPNRSPSPLHEHVLLVGRYCYKGEDQQIRCGCVCWGGGSGALRGGTGLGFVAPHVAGRMPCWN